MAIRVLLITPRFYGIENTIKSVLEESHYEVVWLENKSLQYDFHGTNSKFKFLRRFWFLLSAPQKKYLSRELKKIKNQRFDILFSINAHIICPYLFRKLKKNNPSLFSVLYLWDSFQMYDWTRELKLFNKVFSFDPEDSIKYRLEYKPNFYIKDRIGTISENEYDLFFVGKFSAERLDIIDKISALDGISGLLSFVKLWPGYKILFHNHFFCKILKAFNFKSTWVNNYILNFEAVEGKIHREFIVSESLAYSEFHNHLISSNVILDLPYRQQSGYTHRLIEAIAYGKKIITTNSYITKESFYNPEQIHVIDTEHPEIQQNWVREKSVFPVDIDFSALELSAWIKSILNVEIA